MTMKAEWRKIPGLPYLWTGKTCSMIGDWINNVASLFLILDLTHNGLYISLQMLAKMLPALLFSPYGGVMADRFNRRRILIVTDFFRMLLALVPLLVHKESDIWMMIVGTVALTGASSIYLPAEKGLITEIAPNQVAKANAVLASGAGVSMIVGSAIGGAIAMKSVEIAFVVNAVSYLISLIGVIAVNRKVAVPAREREAEPANWGSLIRPSQIVIEMKEAYQTIRRYAAVKQILMFVIAGSFAGGGINVLLSLVANNIDSGAFGIGMVYAALGAGTVLGSMVVERFLKIMPIVRLIGWATLLEGLFLGAFTQSGNLILAVTLLFFGAIATVLSETAQETMIMEETPEDILGRFYSLNELGSTVGYAVSTAVVGYAATHSLTITGLAVGLLLIVVSGIWLMVAKTDATQTRETSVSGK